MVPDGLGVCVEEKVLVILFDVPNFTTKCCILMVFITLSKGASIYRKKKKLCNANDSGLFHGKMVDLVEHRKGA